MDRRIQKSIRAVYRAFGECLKEKDFASIVVSDILERSGVSRSTFYAHFKDKDELLDSILANIFTHIFSHSLQEEVTHDFSHESVLDLIHLYTHILYHLREQKEIIIPIFGSSCRDRFLNGMREGISPLTERCLNEKVFQNRDMPPKFLLEQINESFLVLVRHWMGYDCEKSPEEMTELFCRLWR